MKQCNKSVKVIKSERFLSIAMSVLKDEHPLKEKDAACSLRDVTLSWRNLSVYAMDRGRRNICRQLINNGVRLRRSHKKKNQTQFFFNFSERCGKTRRFDSNNWREVKNIFNTNLLESNAIYKFLFLHLFS